MKGDKPMTVQTSLRNLLTEALLACRHAAREERGGRGRKKREGEKGGRKGAPSCDTSVQGHTNPAMTKASRDTQGRKVKRGKKERKREGGRKERVRNTPEGKEGRGEGRGRKGGAKFSADSNQEASAAAATYAVPKWLAALTAVVT